MGLQVEPTPSHWLPKPLLRQACWLVAMKHEPKVPLQHPPGVQSVGGQGTPTPRKMRGAVQSVWETTAHEPLAGLQHAPGQELGLQVPALTHTAGAGQLDCGTTAHPPVLRLQHAPEHGLGLHEPPAGPQMPPWFRQLPCVVMMQVITPAALTVQHGPTGGHGFVGVHVEKPESGTKFVGQLVVVVVHAPVKMLQQTIGGSGHGLVGVHVWPTSVSEVVGQFAGESTIVHAPVCRLQHAL